MKLRFSITLNNGHIIKAMNSLRYFGHSMKFKPDWQETKKNPRYEEIEIIGLLDQCKRKIIVDP